MKGTKITKMEEPEKSRWGLKMGETASLAPTSPGNGNCLLMDAWSCLPGLILSVQTVCGAQGRLGVCRSVFRRPCETVGKQDQRASVSGRVIRPPGFARIRPSEPVSV